MNLITFLEGLDFKEYHYVSLQKTTFNEFLIPFLKRKITKAEVMKYDVQMKKLLLTYNKEKGYFLIGGKKLRITPRERQLIFGIKSGKMELSIASGSRSEKPSAGFAAHRFKDSNTLNVGKSKGVLSEKLMNSEDPTDSDDVVRIVILNAMVKFFFTSTGDFVPWFYFQHIENLEDTNLYNWGKEIVDNFITSELQ